MDKYKNIKAIADVSIGATIYIAETTSRGSEGGEKVIIKETDFQEFFDDFVERVKYPKSYTKEEATVETYEVMNDVMREIRTMKRYCNCIEEKDNECLEHMPCFIETFHEKKKPENKFESYYLVQSYVEGKDLRDVMDYFDENYKKGNEQTYTINILLLLLKTSKSLEYLHNKGLVHLDIKPDNIMVRVPSINPNKMEDVVFIDFGYSCLIGECNRELSGRSGRATYRLAPELDRQNELALISPLEDWKPVDIYLLGKWVFRETVDTVLNIDYQAKEKSSGNNDVDKLIEQMLNQNPKKRPKIREVVKELERIINKIIKTNKGVFWIRSK